jgi:hypothetical protein
MEGRSVLGTENRGQTGLHLFPFVETLGNVPFVPGFLITSGLLTNRESARVGPQPKTPHRQ